jgi:diguanylate cyclase (GGDEF)-like protein/PAS domain S-box-containing protein
MVANTDESVLDDVLEGVLSSGAISPVFQPIVDLDTGAVVAYEALARGPEGPLQSPAALFGAAREADRLAELDEACRAAAFRAAVAQRIFDPVPVFVNVEPSVLDTAPLGDLLAIAEGAPGRLRVVLEITERALATRPAELLATVQRVRSLGWGIALDDVGADAASLAFMPLLRPDVVKLDLSLVQQRPTPAVAEIMNAVNAYAERSGALLLAEGIEDEGHLAMARGLGAALGQGWLFGRPAADVDPTVGASVLELPEDSVPDCRTLSSPFACLPAGAHLRRAPKRLLVELSKQLEREAMRLGESCIVAATFQHRHHFTPATAQRYRDLVARVGFVCGLGENLTRDVVEASVPGLRAASLVPDDPVHGEWDVVVLSPHFSAALLARDLGDTGPDMDRTFEYALTYQRDAVVEAAHGLLSRVAPRLPVGAARGLAQEPSGADPGPGLDAADPAGTTGPGAKLLERALAAATSGVTIADMTRPGQPLLFVNDAFEHLAGFSREEVLGRNCRFLQSPETDRAAVARIRAAVAAGEESCETLLNVRGPGRRPWWNEIRLSPVFDDSGRLVQYIGVQTDVTDRVNAERAWLQEQDRSRSYLAQIEQLAWTDPLTGLMNRRRFEEVVETALWEARAGEDALALLFLDLNGFKEVNDDWGHGVGDELLQQIAARLEQRVRRTDMLARLGGDEFLVALTGLERRTAVERAREVAAELAEAVAQPVRLGELEVQVSASIGISSCPEDGDELGRLLHLADTRMYAAKHSGS